MSKTRQINKILEDRTEWLLIDISTKTHPEAVMKVDSALWRECDFGRVRASIGRTSKYIVAKCLYKEKQILFHHIVMPKCENTEIDHKIHGTMVSIDNRISNLRQVTASQNKMNRNIGRNNSSGIKGVYLEKRRKKWRAVIDVNKKRIYLGDYDNIDFAIGARQQAEREYFGEFAFNNKSKHVTAQ